MRDSKNKERNIYQYKINTKAYHIGGINDQKKYKN